MFIMYQDYENWLENRMQLIASVSEQLDEEALANAIYKIGNSLMNGERNWDGEDSEMSETWINLTSTENEIVIGGWNSLTGIELNLPDIYDTLKMFNTTNREQIKMFLTFVLAHERCHRQYKDVYQYSSKEEHDNHPCELRAQMAGYNAVLN